MHTRSLLHYLLTGILVLMLTACGNEQASGTGDEQQALNTIANYVNHGGDAPEISDYQTLHISGVTPENIEEVNALIRDRGAVERDAIKAVIEKRAQALEKLRAYASSNGTTAPPSKEDYAALGVTGVFDADLDAINALIAGKGADEVDSKAEVQAIVEGYTPTPTDMTKPIITLNGAAEVNLTVGAVYIEAGATATDDRDGDITVHITIHNSVDTAIAGTYTLTYDVNDSAGNAADTVSRRVHVTIASTIATQEQTYAPEDTIRVTIGGTLSDDRDWAGVYPVDASNDWGNVIAWNWVSIGDNILNRDMKGMPVGEYEVRLFFHNATDVAKAKAGVSVEYTYGAKGPYFNEIDINDTDEDYILYRPKNHTQDAPVMLFFGMSYAVGDSDAEDHKTGLRHEGLMQYLASLGCYVIGNKKATSDWNDATKWPSYIRALEEAKAKGADTDKLGIIGHSAGAMASYWWMKKYKEDGYGQTKSFIIDLHGYDASKMKKEDLLALTEVDSLIIMYGGLDGNASETTHYGAGYSDFSEDPRVLLTVSHLLPDTVKKGFIALETKDHMYSYGEWEEQIINGDTYNAVKNKEDLLGSVDAMVKYEWFNENGQYNNATEILFERYQQTVDSVQSATQRFLDSGNNYHYGCGVWEGIDYCNDYK